MAGMRERISESLLRTAVDLAASREQLTRSLHATQSDQPGFELAVGSLVLARWVDSLLLWLSVRLRPRPFTR